MKRRIKPNSQMWMESEAAQLLRCSTSHVRNLRFTRQLGCYPGRSVLSQADLEIYVAAVKIIRVRMPGTAKGYAVVPADTRPRVLQTRGALILRKTNSSDCPS